MHGSLGRIHLSCIRHGGQLLETNHEMLEMLMLIFVQLHRINKHVCKFQLNSEGIIQKQSHQNNLFLLVSATTKYTLLAATHRLGVELLLERKMQA